MQPHLQYHPNRVKQCLYCNYCGRERPDKWEYRIVLSRPEEGSPAVLTSESLKDLTHEKGKRRVLSWTKASFKDSEPSDQESTSVKISWTPFKYWKSVERFSMEAKEGCRRN